jgi:hypothetical protein
MFHELHFLLDTSLDNMAAKEAKGMELILMLMKLYLEAPEEIRNLLDEVVESQEQSSADQE